MVGLLSYITQKCNLGGLIININHILATKVQYLYILKKTFIFNLVKYYDFYL